MSYALLGCLIHISHSPLSMHLCLKCSISHALLLLMNAYTHNVNDYSPAIYEASLSAPVPSPVNPHVFCIRPDDTAKLHRTSKQCELQFTAHSSATMKMAISDLAVVATGYCPMQLQRKMHGFHLQFDFDWLCIIIDVFQRGDESQVYSCSCWTLLIQPASSFQRNKVGPVSPALLARFFFFLLCKN